MAAIVKIVPANECVAPANYPAELERDVVLRDGKIVHIRPIRPDDASRLQDLHSRLSLNSAYQRFFSVVKRLLPGWARLLATVDYHRRLALVAEDPAGTGALIAVGRYDAIDESDDVEVAFVVEDGWQNRGLGTIIFGEILRAAAARSYQHFLAYVLADNQRMLDLITRFTRIESRTVDHNVTELRFTLTPVKETSP